MCTPGDGMCATLGLGCMQPLRMGECTPGDGMYAAPMDGMCAAPMDGMCTPLGVGCMVLWLRHQLCTLSCYKVKVKIVKSSCLMHTCSRVPPAAQPQIEALLAGLGLGSAWPGHARLTQLSYTPKALLLTDPHWPPTQPIPSQSQSPCHVDNGLPALARLQNPRAL